MLERFQQLSERERLLVLVLGALIGVLIVVYGIVGPILSMRDDAAADYRQARRLAALTEGLQPPGEESQEDRALRSIVTELADRGGLSYTRINQTAEGGIQIDLDDVPYAPFYAWLESLSKEEDVVVSEAFIEAGDASGTLEARVSLQRAE
ncbi:MAG: type II secretion system protein M [Pseudomonadota bacterium]